MVATPIKVLLFLIGGASAAGATAYVAGVLDPLIYGDDAVAVGIAETAPDEAAPKGERVGSGEEAPPVDATPPATASETPPAAEAGGQEIAALTPDEPPSAGETPPAATDPTPAEVAVDPSIPRFDVVRVEPDGSIVIAGKAPPQSYVEVVTPAEVIASDSATPEGDFAAVPDERLKPGDYEIKLRAIAPGNVVTVSEETALVSIPADSSGQVLALVEKPGEASRIITLPAVAEPKEEEVVAAAPEPEKPAEAAATPAPEKPAEVAAAPEPAVPARSEPEGEAAAPAETAPEQPEGEQQIAAVDPAPAEADGTETAPPQDAADATSPPADGATPPAAGGTEIAAPEPKPEEPAKPAAPAVKVSVEAVEIDGRKVFVAGAADPGLPIRVYANEMMLGENRASPEGRYLVEAERDLPVGDYIIRADALASDGTVIARAAVPFEREPGETIAAVAPPTPEPRPAEPAKAPETAAEPSAPEPAAPEKQPEVAAVPEPKPAEPAKEPETAGAPAAKEPEAASAPDAATDAAKEPEVAAAPEPATPEKQPEVAAVPEPKPVEPAKGPETAAPGAQPEAPAPEVVVPEDAAEIAANPPEITAPKLEASGSGVIIRRGDTLWRISKRVYGRGVRYSTIYLANQDQIENPDRIWPGQVFKVPGETNEGEPADMTAVGEQATSVQ
ncbi:MAG: LysM peptidoglycan-binding domain-containing protein [Rhizobiaceae bacterium]